MPQKLKQKDIEKLSSKGWEIDEPTRKKLNDGKITKMLDKSADTVAATAQTLSTSVNSVTKLAEIVSKMGAVLDEHAKHLGAIQVKGIQDVKIVGMPEKAAPVIPGPKAWVFEIKRNQYDLITEVTVREE